ncbi:MAG: hypothetical protein ACOYT8_00955 [Candidatus Dependentiae bacterium]
MKTKLLALLLILLSFQPMHAFFEFFKYPYHFCKYTIYQLQDAITQPPAPNPSPTEHALEIQRIDKEIRRMKIERKLNKCLVAYANSEKNEEGFPIACNHIIDKFTLLMGIEEREKVRKAYRD